jgi:catechol 2,3-dioxygenase
MMADRTVSESIYIEDPDGNWIEIYVDVSDVWRSDPQAVATVAPLSL